MTDQPARDQSSTSAEAENTAGRPANRLLVVIGAGVGAVVVLGLVIALVVSTVLAGGAASALRIADYPNPPRTEAWSIGHPLAADAAEGEYLFVTSDTVAQDRALIQWSKEGSDDGATILELIDTRSGASVWTLPWEYDSFNLVGVSSAGPLIAASYVDDKNVYFSIDRAGGAIISDTTSRGDTWMPSEIVTVRLPGRGINDFLDVTSLFSGDVVLESDEGVGRYSPHDLENPRWFIERDEAASGPMGVGPKTLHFQGRAYWLDSGQQAPWNGASSVSYTVLDGHMLGSDTGSQGITGVDPASGAQTWRLDLDRETTALLVMNGNLILANSSTSTLVAIDLGTGTEVWTRPVELTVGGNFAALLPDVNAALLPIGGDRSFVTAVDLATGEDLYRMPVSEDGEWWKEFLGSSANYIYLRNSKTGELEAADIRTGLAVWAQGQVTPSASHQVELLGGQFVAVLGSADASDYRDQPALIGLRP